MTYRSSSTGRYVKASTAKRNPGGTVKESGSNSSSGTHYRSASTGKFVKESTAKRNPGGTLKEEG